MLQTDQRLPEVYRQDLDPYAIPTAPRAELPSLRSGRPTFARVLRDILARDGRSVRAIAREVGCDETYLARMAAGDRGIPTHAYVDAICVGAQLSPFEANMLHDVAGYTPPSIEAVGGWSAQLQTITDALASIPPSRRAPFARAIAALVRQVATS